MFLTDDPTASTRTSMFTIRPIAADEPSAFFAVQPDPERAADRVGFFDRMFAAGAMRPEWRYLAIDGDLVVGRFAFWLFRNWTSRSQSS